MKTFRFALLGACALLAAACAKVMEEAPEVTADKPEVTAPVHKITAVIDNDDITKTAYSEETNFGWVAGDRISLIALKDGVSASGYHFGYSADNDGPSSSFSALGTPDWTTYEPSGIAVYPQLVHGWSNPVFRAPRKRNWGRRCRPNSQNDNLRRRRHLSKQSN